MVNSEISEKPLAVGSEQHTTENDRLVQIISYNCETMREHSNI